MSFHLSAWSIKSPIPTLVGFGILTLVGISSFLNLGIDNNPNIDIPAIMVQINQTGAGPNELEFQVAKKVEDAVAGLDNIDQISSTIKEGSSRTIIEFELGTDANQATNDVRNAIAKIRPDLPADINEPVVNRLEFAGGPIMTYAVASPQLSVVEISNLVDQTIIPELLNVRGVARIDRSGGINREIVVELNPNRLVAYGLTANDVNEQIRSFNLNLPGGRVKLRGGEQNIRVLGSAATVEQLQQYPITLSDDSTVDLVNLGIVKDGYREIRQAAWLNDQSVVAFSVFRSTGSTLVEVETAVREAVNQLQRQLSEDVSIELIFTRADEIRDSYSGTMSALVVGCLLTVVVVGLFLRDWRVTLITAVALPLSIIPTFAVMKGLNYTLNSMTLLGLALAVGNLVDDAICMIENIDQHLQQGKNPYRAAIDGAREIGLAVVATTATIVAVFMPVAFMGGIPGQFFQPFGVTVSVATMFSTLVACTMTPMMSAYLLKPKVTKAKSTKRRIRPYSQMLSWALGHRIITLIVAIAFFIGSLQLIPFIPKGLFNEGDRGFTTLQVQLPPGVTLAETSTVVERLTQLFQSHNATKNVFATAGDDDSLNLATLYVNLVPKTEREISLEQFQNLMRQSFLQIPGAKISFQSQGAGGGNKDVEVILQSKNGQLLTETAKQIEAQMRQIDGLIEVDSSVSVVKPEIIVEPNPKRAKDLGVSVQAIASTASIALLGDTDSSLAKFNLSDRQIPIRVKLQPEYQEDLDVLKNLRVPGKDNTLVPISSVAQIRLGSGPAQIERFNRSRQVTLEANLQGISLGEAMDRIQSLETIQSLPDGVEQEAAGDAEIMQEIFARFLGALALAILFIYAILVLLYNNFFYPLAILTALPLSVGGAFLGLLITQKELGLFALIGIVLLMGLVTKNAILLVDFALAGIKEGKPQFRAVLAAGISRLRPILMTSVSTVAGMLPIALGWGADGETRSPMAIAVIGGFSTSTLLTLVVVPVVFTYIYSGYRWLAKLLHKNSSTEQNLNPID